MNIKLYQAQGVCYFIFVEMNLNIVGAAASNFVSDIALAGDYKQAHQAVKARRKMKERIRAKMYVFCPSINHFLLKMLQFCFRTHV